jgi:hypothetical protein
MAELPDDAEIDAGRAGRGGTREGTHTAGQSYCYRFPVAA